MNHFVGGEVEIFSRDDFEIVIRSTAAKSNELVIFFYPVFSLRHALALLSFPPTENALIHTEKQHRFYSRW